MVLHDDFADDSDSDEPRLCSFCFSQQEQAAEDPGSECADDASNAADVESLDSEVTAADGLSVGCKDTELQSVAIHYNY